MGEVLSYFQNLLSKLKGGSIHILTCLLVVLLAGPEIVMAMELSALMEVMGASTFLLMHWYAFLAYIEPAAKKFKEFEGVQFFVPRLDDITSYPALVIHAVPGRSIALLFLLSLYLIIGARVYSVVI
jgi:hypothetical protein